MIDMKMKIYTISLENYHGDTYEEHYFQMENALARFIELRDEGKTHSEFRFSKTCFSFFDPNYNEYSTRIVLNNSALNDLFMDEMVK